MTKIIDNIKIYFAFIGASIREMLVYRIDCIVGALSQIVTQLVEIIFIWIVFQNTKDLAGWNFKQVFLLYGLTLIVIGLKTFLLDGLYELGPTYMRLAEFDKILLRPVHPLISVIGSTKEFIAFGYSILGIVITGSMLIQLQIPITFLLILKIIVFSISGAAIIGAINAIFSITSFWTYRSNEFIWSFDRIYTFAQYPINIYSKFIKILITVILPFAFAAYYPAMNYLGMDKYMIFLSPVIAIIMWFIAIKIWNLALNKYRSAGT